MEVEITLKIWLTPFPIYYPSFIPHCPGFGWDRAVGAVFWI